MGTTWPQANVGMMIACLGSDMMWLKGLYNLETSMHSGHDLTLRGLNVLPDKLLSREIPDTANQNIPE